MGKISQHAKESVERTRGESLALFNDGVLVDLNIGYWSALKRNTEEDLGITPEDVPEFVVGLGTKRLIPKEIAHTWTKLASKARTTVRKYGFLFPIASAWFVPLASLPELEEKLDSLKQEFERTWRAGLLKNYDKLREDFLKEYPEHRSRLQHLFPPRNTLERRFYFEWTAFTVSLPRKLRVEAVNRKRAEENQKAQEKFARELDRRVETFLQESVQTLRAKTVDICANIVEKIKSGEVVTNKSLNALAGFIDRFKTLNFIGDREIENRLEKLKRDILDGNSAETFADDERMRNALASSLNSLKKVAEDITDISDVTKSYRRKLDM